MSTIMRLKFSTPQWLWMIFVSTIHDGSTASNPNFYRVFFAVSIMAGSLVVKWILSGRFVLLTLHSSNYTQALPREPISIRW